MGCYFRILDCWLPGAIIVLIYVFRIFDKNRRQIVSFNLLMRISLLLLHKLEVLIRKLLEFLLQVDVTIVVFAWGIMECDRILTFVADSACSPKKLPVLKEWGWQLANNEHITPAHFDITCRKKVKASALGLIYQKHWVSRGLLLDKNWNSAVWLNEALLGKIFYR